MINPGVTYPPETHAVAPPERDAFIYIHGLFSDSVNQSIEAISRQIVTALENQSKTAAATFILTEGKDEMYNAGKARVVTIIRKDGDQATPIMDIYDMNYGKKLIESYERLNPVYQCLLIALLLLSNFTKLVRAVVKRSKSASHKWQAFLGSLIFLLLAVYMVTLLTTVFSTVYDGLSSNTNSQEPSEQQRTPTQEPGSQAKAIVKPPVGAKDTVAELTDQVLKLWGQLGSWLDEKVSKFSSNAADRVYTPRWLHWMQVLVVLFTSFGLITKIDFKQVLARLSAGMTCANNYLTMGQRRDVLCGQVEALLNYLEEKQNQGQGQKYRTVNIIGYSFGSIIAIDTLFPVNEPVTILKRVDTLITIGCPFDFIRTYWPTYFNNRNPWLSVPAKWINVYTPADVLASDFVDERDRKNPTVQPRGIQVQQGKEIMPKNIIYGDRRALSEYSFFEKFSLFGFKAHDCYWTEESFGNSCFNQIIAEVYADQFALS